MTTSHDEQGSSHHPTFKQYVLVAVILFTITIVEFLLIYDKVGIDDDLGASRIPLLIILSAFKFAIVIMFYMHLKFDAPLFSVVFVAGLILALIVGVALIGLFVGFEGNQRDYAKANAVPFTHEEAEHKGAEEGGGASNELSIGVSGEALEFDTSSIEANAGSAIKLTFANGSTANKHNWVLVQAGSKDEVATAGLGAGEEGDYVPSGDPRVLFNTELLDPGESSVLDLELAAGTYTFVCTFPGHNFSMFGELIVAP